MVQACQALYQAADLGHEGMVAAFLKFNADPDTTGPTGQSALMVAAIEGHAAVVRQLLHAGHMWTRHGGKSGLSQATEGLGLNLMPNKNSNSLPVVAGVAVMLTLLLQQTVLRCHLRDRNSKVWQGLPPALNLDESCVRHGW